MKMPWDRLEGPAKVLAISIAFLLVAAGMCGVQGLIMSGLREDSQVLAPVFMVTGIIELGVVLVAGLTAAGALVAWISTVIYIRFAGSRRTRDETQKLFERSDTDDRSH